MTSKRMEQINRATRILRAIRAGHAYHVIAEGEKVTQKYVSQLAIREGIRVTEEERHFRRFKATRLAAYKPRTPLIGRGG